MSLKTMHPQLVAAMPDLELVADAYAGARTIKSKTVKYLPATPSMVMDGAEVSRSSEGFQAYLRYLERARFPEFYSDAIETMMGMMWHRPPVIELPPQMEDMMENATIHGESLKQLLARINEQQLANGRIGLLADFPTVVSDTQTTPHIVTYNARSIINWDDGRREQSAGQKLAFVVLDESEDERDGFTWKWQPKYRLLSLGDPTQEPSEQYMAALYRGEEFVADDLAAPSWKGKTLEEIPFTFINTKDLLPEPDDPPLLALANLCIVIYRGEADYRQMLFMQGQDTLVVRGGEEGAVYRVGAGATINVPREGDAKYIGVNSQGLSEQRLALENAHQEAREMSGRLIDASQRTRESGDALSTRISAQTATLKTIATTGALGLQHQLRAIARWMGADEEKVVVKPNLDFEDIPFQPRTLVDLMSAKSMGAPLSLQTIHKLMQDRGLTDKDFETELQLIEDEEPLVPMVVDDGTDPEATDDETGGAKGDVTKVGGDEKTPGQRRADRASYRNSQTAAGRKP